jgi:site-specific recombinase XerD
MSARLEDLQRSFAVTCAAEGRSERTVTIYGQAIRFYRNWLAAHGRPATLDELTRAAMREWLAQLCGPSELSTVCTRHKGLQRFCGWLVAEGEIDANPMAGLEAPSAHAKPVPVLTDTELAALLEACNGKTFRDRRDEALIRVLLDCGVRISEACGLLRCPG